MPETPATDASSAAGLLAQLSARVNAADYELAQQDLERLQMALRQVTDRRELRAAHTTVQALIDGLMNTQTERQQQLRTQQSRSARRRGYEQVEALGKP